MKVAKSCGFNTRFLEPDEGKRIVLDPKSGYSYGFLDGDDDCLLREKYTWILIANVLVTPFRMLSRVGYLLSGNSIKNGYEQALLEWEKARYTSLKENPDSLPSHYNLYARVALACSWQTTKDIAKIVTYPLAAIAIEFSAILGYLFPLHARVWISDIERLYSIDIDILKYTEIPMTNLALWGAHHLNLVNFTAFCFQPRAVWDEMNLHRLWGSYSPDTMRSRYLTIVNMTQKYDFIFESVKDSLTDKLDLIKSEIQKTKISDVDEFYLHRNPENPDYSKRQRSRFSKKAPFREEISDLLGATKLLVDLHKNYIANPEGPSPLESAMNYFKTKL